MKRGYVAGMGVLTAGLAGFCGLMYLVVWDRAVKYHFGNDAVSATIIAAACLLGLGAGAYIAGRCNKSSFKTLVWLELAIGLFGALSFYLIVPGAAALAGALKPAPEQAAGVHAAVVAGSLLLLLPPSALIGGSLPLLFRCFSATATGLVYGSLALGASLGMFLLPVLFMNRFDLPAVLMMAGVINAALALTIFLWSRRLPDVPAAGDEAAPVRPLPHALAFISGFFAIVLCVSLLRALPIASPSSAWNFPLVLVLFLLALALGSLLLTRGVAGNRDDVLYRIGWLLCASGLAMFLGIWIASHLQANLYPVSFLPLLEGNYATLPWVLLFSVALIMPAPFFLGAVLPLLLKLHADGARAPGRRAGGLLLSMFLGACCGLILGRFAGFPLLGTRGLLSFVYLVACGSGTALMVWIWRRNIGRGGVMDFSGALPGGMLALAVMVAIIMPSGIWLTYITGGPERNWEVREGISGIAQLWWEDEHADVRVNGEYMSRLPYHPRHLNQEVFLLAQPQREKVLVLGMGSAEIIRSLVEDPGVQSIDVVDRSHELPEILSAGKAAGMLNHALASPKVRILTADARVAIGLYEAGSFDVVFDNLAFASWAGATGVKSATYFRGIRRILKPEGVFLGGANYHGENRLAVLAGLLNTFEIVQEHRQAPIVIATSKEPQYFDFRIIQLAEPRAAIFGLNYFSPDVLPAWFRNELVRVSGEQLQGVAPIRDELPVYEFLLPAL